MFTGLFNLVAAKYADKYLKFKCIFNDFMLM